jgi:hypothetical protein
MISEEVSMYKIIIIAGKFVLFALAAIISLCFLSGICQAFIMA